MNLDLTLKRAIVCGSTQGIGKATAIELASLGASVTLLARNEDKLKQVLQELPVSGQQQHHYLIADFSQPQQVKQVIEHYVRQQSSIHILVNNTGGPPAGTAIEADTDEYLHAFTQHLICNHILVQALVPAMQNNGYGRIVNIISTSVKQPIPNLGVSNTVRGAVASWAKTLSVELGPSGITVNNVLPGSTRTGRLYAMMENKAKQEHTSVAEVEQAIIANIPVRRFAEAAEVAAAIAFLCSPAAAYINGINLPVDGGKTSSL